MSTASDRGDISIWLDQAKQGDKDALERLHEAYYQRLVNFARRKLGQTNRRFADEEGIANDAMYGVFQCMKDGRYTKLDNRDDLWKLLAVITRRIVKDEVEKARADKRGGGKVRGESVFAVRDDSCLGGIDQIASESLSPDGLVQNNDTIERLLSELNEKERDIALAKLAGYRNDEIAAKLGVTKRQICRKLAMIRKAWEQ